MTEETKAPDGASAGVSDSTRLLAEDVLSVVENMERLRKLTNEQLVTECLTTDAADYLVVEEMMNRLWPKWAGDDNPQSANAALSGWPGKELKETEK